MGKFLDGEGVTSLWRRMVEFVTSIPPEDDTQVIYKAADLSFDGTNYEEVDFQPFAEDTHNFRLTMRIQFDPADNTAYGTIFCCHTWDADANELKGITIRKPGSNDYDIQVNVNNVNYGAPLDATDDARKPYVYVVWTRIDGTHHFTWHITSYSAGSYGQGSISFANEAIDNKVFLGASEKEDGTIQRYAVGTVDYIKIVKI